MNDCSEGAAIPIKMATMDIVTSISTRVNPVAIERAEGVVSTMA
jgi:hypothetical protein